MDAIRPILNNGAGSGGRSFGGMATVEVDELCTYNLQSMVMEIALRAGMDPRSCDASQLHPIQCRGFTVSNQYPASNAILALSQVFLFDPSNYDGKVHFILRGADVAATITQDDFVIDEALSGAPDPLQDQSSRADSIQIPERLNLNYFDVSGGLATSLQSSQRVGDPRAVGSQDLQTAVILNADEAARVVKINHQVMVEDSKAQLNFTLSDKFLQLVVADTVFVPYNDKTYRARITQVDMDDGKQSLQLLQDRQSAYTSNIQGIPAYVPTPPPSVVVGPTSIYPIDSHIIRDTDDSLGVYFTVGAAVNTWKGALIEVSLDGGESYFSSFNDMVASVAGVLDTPISDHPAAYPDTVNSAQITLLNPDDEIESASQVQMLNGTNLAIIGNEIIQFGNVAEASTPGTWNVDYFFRGRKGTSTQSHSAGERFVLLDRSALLYIPMQLSYIGRSITVRATSFNGTDSDITTVNFTYTGQSQVEYPVAYLSARRAGSQGLLSWQGVGKLGAGAKTAMGLYFSGYRITLTAGSKTQTFTTADQAYAADLSGFNGSITATVQAMNSLTGAGPAVSVVF